MRRENLIRWSTAGLAAALLAAPMPARAESVAEQLISVLEANGQLTREQAAEMREQAALEREELKREVMDEVQVSADQIYSANAEFEDVASGDRAVVVADLAESMKIGGYVQFLASFAPNESVITDGGGNRKNDPGFDTSDFRETDGFSIRRARVKLSGNVGPNTKYVIQFDGDNIDNTDGDDDNDRTSDRVNINDVYMEYNPPFFAGTAFADTWIRAGQFKPHFSREFLLSSSKRLPIARSHYVNQFTPGRDVGVMIYNEELVDGRLAAYLTVYNAGKEGGEIEDNNDPFNVAGRVTFDVLDGRETDFGEADFQIGASILGGSVGNGIDDPIPGPGDGYELVDPLFVNGGDGEIRFRGQQLYLGADAQLDIGPFGLNGEFIYADLDPRSNSAIPLAGTSVTQAGTNNFVLVDDDEFWGFHVMPSFWIVPDTLQAYFKYEYVEYGDVLDADMWATTLGVNYHMLPKHRSLIRANWVHLEHESDLVPGTLTDDDFDQDFFLFEWQVKI